MLENRVPRKDFGPRRDKLTGEWKRQHNEELNALYSSLNAIRVITSGRMIWAGYVVCIGGRRDAYKVNLRERDHLENLSVDRRILNFIFNKLDGKTWNGLIWLGKRTGGGACVCGNDPSGCIECKIFF